ncbi:restriction endonuclease subunit S [Flavobacterium sp. FBOR7N2.3]|uniref:Restriction endonuclease subunit S n=1 Tax=Flavobacterium magnesitis TaxID=3138077 RepID=A0ABV4TH36_9FLAO
MQKVKIAEVCTMQSGGTPSRSKSEYYNGTIPWSKISDLEKSNDGYIYKTEEHITTEGLKSINNRFFKKGTLLLAMYGSVGKTAIAKIDLSTNQAILGINIKDEAKLDVRYLRFWFTTIKEQLLNRAVGAALANISLGIVKDLEIPLPPLPTQQKIATILDKADELRQYNKQLIEKYDALTQSLFLEMFGDPVMNEKGWEKRKLNEFLEVLVDVGSNGGNDWVSANIKMKDEEDYAIMIRTTNLNKNDFKNNLKYVSKETYDLFKKTKVFGGEIIMNKIGSAGDFWLMPILNKPVSLGLNQLMMTFNNLDKIFFFFFFSTDYGKKIINSKLNGATTKSITKTALRDLDILYPPINLQNQFAERVQLIEGQRQQAQEALAKSEELFQSLLQRAFKGELN